MKIKVKTKKPGYVDIGFPCCSDRPDIVMVEKDITFLGWILYKLGAIKIIDIQTQKFRLWHPLVWLLVILFIIITPFVAIFVQWSVWDMYKDLFEEIFGS